MDRSLRKKKGGGGGGGGGTGKAAQGRGNGLYNGSAEGEVAQLGGTCMKGSPNPSVHGRQDLLVRTLHDGGQIDQQRCAYPLILYPCPATDITFCVGLEMTGFQSVYFHDTLRNVSQTLNTLKFDTFVRRFYSHKPSITRQLAAVVHGKP